MNISVNVDELIAQFQEKMPPLFAGTELDFYTGKAYSYRSLLNEISRGEAPRDILIKQGIKKNLVVRDRFLPHFRSKLTTSATTPKHKAKSTAHAKIESNRIDPEAV